MHPILSEFAFLAFLRKVIKRERFPRETIERFNISQFKVIEELTENTVSNGSKFGTLETGFESFIEHPVKNSIKPIDKPIIALIKTGRLPNKTANEIPWFGVVLAIVEEK